ncbi:hypothetical protein [Chlamydia felis Fe/C-56]|uniref:Uncharacterized protein n=1 Tax=Chlamydia felis (strain Fe/C-56) TaxID=264202 RepID=Q254N8_CHLFF|nr:hypothetical protein [Chlamydia felis Fe/C-56]
MTVWSHFPMCFSGYKIRFTLNEITLFFIWKKNQKTDASLFFKNLIYKFITNRKISLLQ